MKQVVVAVFLLFLRVYFVDAEDVYATVGSTTSLYCPLNLILYGWYKQYNSVALTDRNKYDGISSNTLTIRVVEMTDAGYYYCEGYPVGGGGTTIQNWVLLTVTETAYATVGGTTSLYCPLNLILYGWYKQYNSVALTDRNKYDGISSNTLTIRIVEMADAGYYYCEGYPVGGGSTTTQNWVLLTVTGESIGTWSTWGQWNECSLSCGTGHQTRSRFCTTGSCTGPLTDSRQCILTTCKVVDGGWSHWNPWSVCSVTCGTGVQDTKRFCNNPLPQNGGNQCTGQENDQRPCHKAACPAWSSWNSWEACTATCGISQQRRERFCNNPSPQKSGDYCPGNGFDQRSCTMSACSVDGGWSYWNPWESCTVTCGNSEQRRKRFCNSPSPLNGAYCVGNDYDERSCPLSLCPVDGRWSSWDPWTVCNVTCGTGHQDRSRSCNNPLPQNGGSYCTGEIHDNQPCTVSQCEEANAAGSAAPIAGGVGGGIVVIVCIVVIIAVYITKSKRRKHVEDRVSDENQGLADTPVSLRQGHQDGMYINIGRASRQSSSDTDDVLPSKAPTTENVIDEGTTYQNLPDILTTVKIEDLKDYIKLKDSNEGLQSEYKTIPYGPQHPTTIAQRKENVIKNRFKTTFPYDHTRVTLHVTPGSANADYINANFVDGFEKENCYIASQGPLKHTFHDFWTMIWQNNTRTIIMLTNLIEGKKEKCGKYWPEGGKPMVLGNFILTLQSEKERAAYVTREISVEDKKTKEKRNVIQYHFTAWPDHGTPDPLYLVLFHKRVISDQSDALDGKLLVHCSAGIGRTGTYIGLDALYEEGRVTGCVDIVKFVKKMRYSRMNMVQTPEQYVCLHYALLEAFTMNDTNIRKDEFGTIWRKIQSDKQPINHLKLYKEFKMLEAKKFEHGKSEFISALSTENIQKNRNESVIPSDNNRLFLTSYEKGRTDYINAVQVPSYTKFVGYLTTQLPLPETKIDFWTMVRDHSSSTIVMFINEQTEAELVYAATDDTFLCGSLTMKITRREKEEFDILSCTVVLSRKDEKAREIVIYCAVCSGYPKPNVLCKLVNMISTRVSRSHDAVTVVSGDGAKNCGLFCTFANAVSSMTIDNNADIFQLARLLQLRRPEFFADFEEYRLCFEALNFYLESTNVYANF